MLQVWKEGGHCQSVTVLYNPSPIQRGEVQAIGTVATYGEAFGPDGMPGKRAATGAGGSGCCSGAGRPSEDKLDD